jgi:hypothetical protein
MKAVVVMVYEQASGSCAESIVSSLLLFINTHP